MLVEDVPGCCLRISAITRVCYNENGLVQYWLKTVHITIVVSHNYLIGRCLHDLDSHNIYKTLLCIYMVYTIFTLLKDRYTGIPIWNMSNYQGNCNYNVTLLICLSLCYNLRHVKYVVPTAHGRLRCNQCYGHKGCYGQKAPLQILNWHTWSSIQSECADFQHMHAYLSQGTRPSKKLANIRNYKIYLNVE